MVGWNVVTYVACLGVSVCGLCLVGVIWLLRLNLFGDLDGIADLFGEFGSDCDFVRLWLFDCLWIRCLTWVWVVCSEVVVIVDVCYLLPIGDVCWLFGAYLVCFVDFAFCIWLVLCVCELCLLFWYFVVFGVGGRYCLVVIVFDVCLGSFS